MARKSNNMKEYSIATIIWQDHWTISRSPLPKNVEDSIRPTLTVGVILQETENVLVLASDIERYEDHDDVSYTIIFKNAIVARKEYGTIKLKKPRKGVVS